ncbi:nitroreductase [Clostridium sp. Marseille-P2415]|uniref:nitroreductase n=1 Tax=Clostridium sp. Marseille-P2415 TaxID=1805471 RepID=UPI0009888403|nr:nitroreductase [Clostridium sp. Marseille-P2415]
MNETIKNLLERRSVRSYTSKQVAKEVLHTILEAGTFAPSGMNRQPVVMAAVQNPEIRDRLSKLNASVTGTDNDPFYGAPTVIVVLADRTSATYVYDGSVAMANLMNAAHAVGVDSCWVHRAREVFESEEGKQLLKEWGIQGDYEGIGHCILGYGADEYPQAKPRKEHAIVYVE